MRIVMAETKIVLDDDETMLLMAAKGWPITGVDDVGYHLGSAEYLQAVCDVRCFGSVRCDDQHRAAVFEIYLPLAEKLLRPSDFCQVLKRLHADATFWGGHGDVTMSELAKRPAEVRIVEYLIGRLSVRRTSDLVLDESKVARK
jgi:hypothetical protein